MKMHHRLIDGVDKGQTRNLQQGRRARLTLISQSETFGYLKRR